MFSPIISASSFSVMSSPQEYMRVTHILMKSISLEVINNHKTRFKTHILLCCISILGRLRNMKRAHIYAVLACLCVLLGYMIGGKQPKIVVGFSPNGQAESLVFDAIKGAESSIFVAAYTFTSKPIAEALLSAHKRGVSVYLVVDAKSKGAALHCCNLSCEQWRVGPTL